MTALRLAPTVRKVQGIIGYKFKNAQYLWEAVQAPGSIVRSGEIVGPGTERHSVGFQSLPDGNRRLAVLGDTVLKLALVEDWYKGEAVRGMARSVSRFRVKRYLQANREALPCRLRRRLERQSRHDRPHQRIRCAHQ